MYIKSIKNLSKCYRSLMIWISFCSIWTTASAISNANNENLNDPQYAMQNIADQYFKSYSTVNGFTALGITVQCDGFNHSHPTTVFSGTMGYPERDPRPVQNDELWQIGSNSKSFATVILLQLASEPRHNNFNLDDPLDKWLPEYSYYTWTNGTRPTIRQIMNMTSGIPNDLNDDWLEYYLDNQYKYLNTYSMITKFALKSLSFKPSTSWLYSNTGYQILGLLIERITGNSVNMEIMKRIIIPLGLHNTYFIEDLPGRDTSILKLIHGYFYPSGSSHQSKDGKDIYLASLSGGLFIAGNIISTPIDMNTYFRTLFMTSQLLNNSQFQELSTLVSTENGQPINSPKDSNNGIGYGLGISAANLAFTEESMLHKYPNLWTDRNRYRFVYLYSGDTLGFTFTTFYNPINSASIMIAVNSSVDNITPVLLSTLNYLDPICKIND